MISEESRTIPIRNYNLPKFPRVFDVVIDGTGRIERYLMQNIQAAFS